MEVLIKNEEARSIFGRLLVLNRGYLCSGRNNGVGLDAVGLGTSTYG